MDIYTKNPKINTLNKIEVDSGGRETAACRWEKYKETTQRTALYHVSAPNITPEDSLLILELERLYIETYSEWEASTINDVQYKILQDYLPPEYFLDVLAVYLCVRYYDFPGTIEEMKNKTFHITEEDRHYFINYLRSIYLPAITEFIDKCKEIRPRYVIYKEMAGIFEETSGQGENIQLDPDKSLKLSNLLLEFNKGMHLFLTCLNDNEGTTIELSEIFGDLAEKIISGHGCTKETENIPMPIEKAQAIYSDTFLVNSTKAAQNLGEITEYGQTHGYVVSRTKGKKKPKDKSIVTVMLSSTESNSVKLTRPITLTDRAIIEAVETLAQHNVYITAAEVYRMMNGGDNIRMRPELIEEIENRIDYMRHIMAYIDYSQHMNMNGHEGKYTREDTLLNLTKERVSLNGKTVTAYKYKDVSPLFKYARDVGQIVSIPSAMLSTRSGQKGGIRAQAIKHYLLQRLFTIKGQGSIISLETLLKAIGEPEPSPDQLRKIRAIIENFLEIWSYGKLRTSKTAPDKEILGKTPIKGFSVNTVGKKITGYTLIPKVLEVSTK